METSMVFAVKFLQVWVFQLNINTHMLLILELQPVRRNDVLFKGKKIRNSPYLLALMNGLVIIQKEKTNGL